MLEVSFAALGLMWGLSPVWYFKVKERSKSTRCLRNVKYLIRSLLFLLCEKEKEIKEKEIEERKKEERKERKGKGKEKGKGKSEAEAMASAESRDPGSLPGRAEHFPPRPRARSF